jgi:hypothetical protein
VGTASEIVAFLVATAHEDERSRAEVQETESETDVEQREEAEV